jgi:hypothetical protein
MRCCSQFRAFKRFWKHGRPIWEGAAGAPWHERMEEPE